MDKAGAKSDYYASVRQKAQAARRRSLGRPGEAQKADTTPAVRGGGMRKAKKAMTASTDIVRGARLALAEKVLSESKKNNLDELTRAGLEAAEQRRRNPEAYRKHLAKYGRRMRDERQSGGETRRLTRKAQMQDKADRARVSARDALGNVSVIRKVKPRPGRETPQSNDRRVPQGSRRRIVGPQGSIK